MEVLSRGWQTDLALLALSGSTVVHHPTYAVVRTPSNPSFYWGNFLLLRRAPQRSDVERVLALHAVELPDARHVSIGVDDPQSGLSDLAPLADLGLETERSVVLTTDSVLPVKPPDADVEVRALRSDADWAAQLDLHLAVSGGELGPAYREFLTRRVRAQRSLTESGVATWFGAFAAPGMVSGLGIVAAGNGLARYQEVETHPGWRRRGLAGTLVHTAGRHAVDVYGAGTLVIVADPDYPAIGLYRALGFTDSDHQLQAHRPPPG